MNLGRKRASSEYAPVYVRKADERGHQDHGWLNTYHTFSFADYYDPRFSGFRTLRVINEDRVQPGQGFPMHAHRDMEILTYVVDGSIAHKDSMGNASVIRPGELQRMSAGTGVRHSEFNASDSELLHLLQIWIIPDQAGLEPSYEQRAFPEQDRVGNLKLIASPDGRSGSLKIHQDALLYAAILPPGEAVEDRLPDDRYAWVQMVRGSMMLNGELLAPGDGAALRGGGLMDFKTPLEGSRAEFLLFNLS